METKTKKCKHCQKEKPVTEFKGHKTSSDGLQSWCRECSNDYTALAEKWKDIGSSSTFGWTICYHVKNKIMKREIKFRGKIKISGKWLYGDYLRNRGEHFIAPPGIADSTKMCEDFDFEINPDTLGQYTGLKDKNGKEIYEGDLISVNGRTYEVVYFKGMFAFEIEGCGYVPLQNVVAEVVGNIHEQTEKQEAK